MDISYRRVFVVSAIETFQRIRDSGAQVDKKTAREILKSTTRRLIKQEKEEVEREEF